MLDWNVVVTTRERGFIPACELLEKFGRINKTNYFNVLAMRVEDVRALMEGLLREYSENPSLPDFLTWVMPVDQTLDFRTSGEFETRAGEAALSHCCPPPGDIAYMHDFSHT